MWRVKLSKVYSIQICKSHRNPMEKVKKAKLISNIEEISARKAPVISVVQKGDVNASKVSDFSFEIPEIDPVLSPFPVAVFLQLLSYYISHELGTEIDKPRNLAKSVTVE